MKWIFAALIGYFGFALGTIRLQLGETLSFTDYANALLLNTAEYPALRLDPVNFPYMLTFLLLCWIFLYLFIQEVSECVSFLNLVIYRQGKVKTLRVRALACAKQMVFYVLFCTVLVIIFIILLRGLQWQVPLPALGALFLYFVRFFLLLFICIYLYELAALCGYSGSILLLLAVYILLVILDVFSGLHCITFTGVPLSELLWLFLVAVGGGLLCLLGTRYYMRKKDIL